MGVYALSKRGCTISSRARGPLLDLAPGWRVALTPDCFLGKEDADVVDGDTPWPHGTTISFMAHESLATIESALAGAALHCPLPVTFNGVACKRKAFLDGALHVERWRGLVFGVFRNTLTGFNDPDLNFHGLTLSVRLPSVDPVESGAWSVRADIEACPELELVLPARREAVETEFLKEMREAARLAVYRAMAAADPEPRIALQGPQEGCRGWHRAPRAAGRAPPLAARHRRYRRLARHPVLRARRRRHAGHGGRSRDPGSAGVLARRRAGGNSRRRVPVRARHTRFEGYAWYGRARARDRFPHRGLRGRRDARYRCAAGGARPCVRRPHRGRASPTRSPGPTGSTCTSASSGATSRPRP